MAVDINEYRKQRIAQAEKEMAAAQNVSPLLEQATVPDASLTGNSVLDKLLRALQPVMDQLSAGVTDSALAAMKAPEDKIFAEIRFQHLYMLGKLDGFKELAKIAQAVAVEEKKNAIILPQ